jgi:hypothetical protein
LLRAYTAWGLKAVAVSFDHARRTPFPPPRTIEEREECFY